jgi:hypothetical protein
LRSKICRGFVFIHHLFFTIPSSQTICNIFPCFVFSTSCMGYFLQVPQNFPKQFRFFRICAELLAFKRRPK